MRVLRKAEDGRRSRGMGSPERLTTLGGGASGESRQLPEKVDEGWKLPDKVAGANPREGG